MDAEADDVCPVCEGPLDCEGRCRNCSHRLVAVHDHVRMHELMELKERTAPKGKPHLEDRVGVRGDDLRPGTGMLIYERRTIRRDVPDGRWQHHVTKLDAEGVPTGEADHNEDETLREHNEKKRRLAKEKGKGLS